MVQSWQGKHIPQYAASKLIGSGVLYLVTILITNGLHFDKWPETATRPYYWIIYYGYATIISLIVDYLTRKTIPEDKILYKLPLYFLGGALPFLYFIIMSGFNGFVILASLFGIVGASLYYGVSNYAYHAKKLWPYSGILSLATTVFLIVLVFLK
ncbi:hypothetical protein [Paenibacillus sp. YIM B09110]|uniref:hypothetical protein n=1 Tax=Paenibacillus sp. YIM B09110 TaxID=3126102 RepID=UPI00301CBED3